MSANQLKKAFLPLLITAVLASFTGASAANLVSKVGASPFGKIVVNAKGMTAYFYDLDKANSGRTACLGACATIWPPITSGSIKPSVTGISGAVATIAISGGRHQVTIAGRPIYTYALDKAPGQAKGQGVQGIWYVISPAGKEIRALKAPLKPTPKTSSIARY